MDELRKDGTTINLKKLSKLLHVPVIPISALTGEGIPNLIDNLKISCEHKEIPPLPNYFHEDDQAINNIRECVTSKCDGINCNPRLIRYYVAKILEEDQMVINDLHLDEEQQKIINYEIKNIRENTGLDPIEYLVDNRYNYITNIVSQCMLKNDLESVKQRQTQKIDKILTNKFLGIPIFIGIMFLIFWLTFHVIGVPLQELVEAGITSLTDKLAAYIETLNWSEWMRSLLIDGILAGVGGVLTFLPIIILLFFFLYFLEDSGYMARVAYMLDKLLQSIGLSGKSIVPLIIGFGCSVPAIMSTRTLNSARDRKLTMLLIPFMSCSAKIPIYGMISSICFPNNAALVTLSMYLLGIVVAIVTSFIFSKTLLRGKAIPFVMELPNYRIPSFTTLAMQVWTKAKGFVIKTFTIILAGSIVIWLLQTITINGHITDDAQTSILADLSRFIAPLFSPLGFDSWQAISALITGVAAKETVVSTLEVIAGNGNDLETLIKSIFTPASALSFLSFSALYFPCFAAFATLRKELGSFKDAVIMVCIQTGIAYIVAFIIYHIALLFV